VTPNATDIFEKLPLTHLCCSELRKSRTQNALRLVILKQRVRVTGKWREGHENISNLLNGAFEELLDLLKSLFLAMLRITKNIHDLKVL
jgi:hypothetical protein